MTLHKSIMSNKINSQTRAPETGFDLFRLSKSKSTVDLCPNTLRAYFKAGLPCYRMGKAIFISRSQLQQFIVAKGT
jgi:hypothetical protein